MLQPYDHLNPVRFVAAQSKAPTFVILQSSGIFQDHVFLQLGSPDFDGHPRHGEWWLREQCYFFFPRFSFRTIGQQEIQCVVAAADNKIKQPVPQVTGFAKIPEILIFPYAVDAALLCDTALRFFQANFLINDCRIFRNNIEELSL